MARKIRFPLMMKNGADVRTLEELRSSFDLESVLGYFENGKLKTWLEDRYYDSEAQAISSLDKDDAELSKKISEILGVSYSGDEIDMDEIERRNEKLRLIRQYSDDKEIIDNIDSVAFDQDDLLDILDSGIRKIYLCAGAFEIPVSVGNTTYIGIKEPQVKLANDNKAEYNSNNIKFIGIPSVGETAEELVALGIKYLEGNGVEKDAVKAFEIFEKAADMGSAEAQCKLGWCYMLSDGVEYNAEKAVEWYRKAAEQDNVEAQYQLGFCYRYQYGVDENYEKAIEWFRKAAEQGDADAQNELGICYYKGYGVEKDHRKAVEWYNKAADQGLAEAQNRLGNRYYEGEGVEKNEEKAKELFQKAAAQGCEDAKVKLDKMTEQKPNQGFFPWMGRSIFNPMGYVIYETRSEKSERIRDLIYKGWELPEK